MSRTQSHKILHKKVSAASAKASETPSPPCSNHNRNEPRLKFFSRVCIEKTFHIAGTLLDGCDTHRKWTAPNSPRHRSSRTFHHRKAARVHSIGPVMSSADRRAAPLCANSILPRAVPCGQDEDPHELRRSEKNLRVSSQATDAKP